MIQMKLNQVVLKYIKVKDSLQSFVKKKRTKLRIFLSKKQNTFEEEDCGFRDSRKDYKFKDLFFFFLVIGGRGRMSRVV